MPHPSLFSLACFVATLLTPLSMSLAVKVRAIDCPDSPRKSHTHPTPCLGGLAIFLSIAFFSLLFLPLTPLHGAWLSGGALLCVLGVSDDIFSLSPRLKMLAMLFVSLLPICFGLSPKELAFGSAILPIRPVFSAFFTFFWLLLLTNAYNLIDGLDGLAVGQGALSAMALAFSQATGDGFLLSGALLGFLPYNREAAIFSDSGPFRKIPTRSFLGDTGALFVGYSLGLLSLGSHKRFSLLLPLLFALPLYELVSSVLRRLFTGRNPFSADGRHLHHRLIESGFSRRAAVLLLLLYALLFACLYLLAEILFPLL